ncbi:MAG: phospholipase D-like domain-containing protein, partial [Alphaproteobacteria bacterium]|nr:phospholipase D-like domain-containing protein [Alphaproteobacteria bacterium]
MRAISVYKVKSILVACLVGIFCLSGCIATSTKAAQGSPQKEKQYALKADYNTIIGKSIIEGRNANPGKSAFRLITKGSEAFFGRVAMIRFAEHSLDLQYYIVEDDLTGSMLLEEILRAADRGVRVRLLVDSLAVSKVHGEVSLLSSHPNISIRVFNPVVLQDESFVLRMTTWVFDFERANKRMHNKALIADNLTAIIGGRNLGDQYFDASADYNFSDMDVMAAGPVVSKISHSFDNYWNSDPAYDLTVAEDIITDAEALKNIRLTLDKRWKKAVASDTGGKVEKSLNLWKQEGKLA